MNTTREAPDHYHLRQARPADLPAIIRLRGEMFRQVAPEPFDAEAFAAYEKGFLAEEMNQGRFLAWVAEVSGGPVAACAALSVYRLPPKPWNRGGLHGYVSSMFTEPEHRRRGLARRLLDTVLAKAGELKLEWVTLHASDQGRTIYAAAGFNATNEMRIRLPSNPHVL